MHRLTPPQPITLLLARSSLFVPRERRLYPRAVAASLPFAPEIVAPALRYFEALKLRESNPYGFKATFNATIAQRLRPPQLWVSPFHFGINQGPIVLMIENFRTGLIWSLTRRCPYLAVGLDRAGFAGGWLGVRKIGRVTKLLAARTANELRHVYWGRRKSLGWPARLPRARERPLTDSDLRSPRAFPALAFSGSWGVSRRRIVLGLRLCRGRAHG